MMRTAIAAALVGVAAAQNNSCTGTTTFYTASRQALLLNGSSVVSYASFAGNVLMITNVASF
jgi:hypothetical protein